MDIYEAVDDYLSRGRSGALATIIKKMGAGPREEGAKMFVGDDGRLFGSVGGGCVEAEVWQAAKDVARRQKVKTLHYRLDGRTVADEGMICGGNVDIFLEPVLDRYKNLYASVRDLEKRGKDALIITRFSEDSYSKSLVEEEGFVSGDDVEEEIKERFGSYLKRERTHHRRRDHHRAHDLVLAPLPVWRRPYIAVRVDSGVYGRLQRGRSRRPA